MTSAFRCHDQQPPRVTSPLFRQLINDWIHLNQLRSTQLALHRWACAEPALAGYPRPADLVDAVDHADPATQDQILAALIRLTQDGHQLAGRILLQLLLPKLGKMALRTNPTSSDSAWGEDRRHIIVAEFWDIVAGYPIHRRTRKVAANLALETLHRITNPRGHRVDLPVDPDTLGRTLTNQELASDTDLPLPGGLTCDASLVDVVDWAVQQHVITTNDAQLLLRVYLPHPNHPAGSPSDRVAAELGLTPAALRKRCSRARRQLVDAVRDETQPRPLDRVA